MHKMEINTNMFDPRVEKRIGKQVSFSKVITLQNRSTREKNEVLYVETVSRRVQQWSWQRNS